VRVQRLQDMSGADARAEGVFHCNTVDLRAPKPLWYVPGTEFGARHPKLAFASFWNSLNADRASWASNPWVVAITFRPVLGNIDQLGGRRHG